MSILVALYEPMLIRNASAHQYSSSKVVTWSRYNTPLNKIFNRRLKGESRNWGHADLQVQAEVCQLIVSMFSANGFFESEIAFALALVSVESGFNPDAAAIQSSAAGLGQFIRETEKNIMEIAGIKQSNPFDAFFGVQLLLLQVQDCLKRSSQFPSSELFLRAYEYHHDGPKRNNQGFEIAEKKIKPLLPKAQACVKAVLS